MIISHSPNVQLAAFQCWTALPLQVDIIWPKYRIYPRYWFEVCYRFYTTNYKRWSLTLTNYLISLHSLSHWALTHSNISHSLNHCPHFIRSLTNHLLIYLFKNLLKPFYYSHTSFPRKRYSSSTLRASAIASGVGRVRTAGIGCLPASRGSPTAQRDGADSTPVQCEQLLEQQSERWTFLCW